MQGRRTRRHETQLLLFCPPPQTPDWHELNKEDQQKLLPLLARLLVEHREGVLRSVDEKGVIDE